MLVAFAVALLTSACQSTMSLDEARRVTTQFAGRSFVPPPRTVADVTAILEQDRDVDSEVVANARTLVDQPPPETSDRETLADFYYRRGRAAGVISRIPQWIDDLSRAAEYVPRGDILDELANAHWAVSNLSRAIDIRRQISGPVWWDLGRMTLLIANKAKLARLYVITGDLDAAEAAMREAAVFLRGGSPARIGRLHVVPLNILPCSRKPSSSGTLRWRWHAAACWKLAAASTKPRGSIERRSRG